MNWIDITLITIIGYNALIGFKRGLVRLIVDMAAFMLAIWVSTHYGASATKWVEMALHQTPPTSTIIGYLTTWLGTFGVLSFVGYTVSKALPVIGIGIADRLGGLFIGMVKGMLLCVPIIMPVQFFKAELLNQSIMAPPLEPLVTWVGATLFPRSDNHIIHNLESN